MEEPNKLKLLPSNLSAAAMSGVLTNALKQSGLISDDDTALIFYDLSFLEQRVKDLINLFPHDTLHAIAVKANPLTGILVKIKEMGAGLEVASLPELYLAEKAGFSPRKVVFDSPAKTKQEIEYALKLGVHLNADSFDELDRIAGILETISSESTIGVRINPQVGSGSITSTSVAGSVSKFGIPLNDHRDKLKTYYRQYSWLTGIHVHIGSQGCQVSMIIDGIGKVLDFANEVNESLPPTKNQITVFDIGGGLPVSYHPDKVPVSMQEYSALLRENFPDLFNGKFRLITEFGRYIHANTGWVASKVEYVKRENGCNIIMTHVGADLFLRKAYNPSDWHHEVTVVDKTGKLKAGKDENKYIIAGPLCFAGDIIARDLELPVVEEGDYILIHDTGAYTLSMWSRYNSRQIPKVIGYCGNNTFEVLKERESKEDLLRFWS
jgi:diaminopimelate decarboxylase